MSDASKPYYARTDAGLVAWSTQFVQTLETAGPSYGPSAPQITSLSEANDLWIASAANTANPETKTKVTVAAKRDARRAFLEAAKNIIAIIDSNPAVTTAMKEAIDIPISKPRERRNAPTVSPAVDFGNREGAGVWITIHQPGNARRAKPPEADGIQVYYLVGAEPSNNPADWTFSGTHTRREALVQFPSNLPAGTQVWIACSYFNARGTGPGSEPITTVLAGGGGFGKAKMKLAA